MIGGYGLTFRQKVKLWRDTESAKLRTMTFGGKIGYIFTYYWKWMLLFLIVVMFCGYVGDAVVQAHKEIVLEEAQAPILAGQKAGEAVYYLNDKAIGSVDLYYTDTVRKAVYKDYLVRLLEKYLL